ncbi:hypothetical protein BOTBODRAFT_33162 [Botryobasidium botryosum FD-172 SS1]|uniref:polynucleotide adenylyltransferase n=1 Tax=Botryobasidium botryosum (strain FD-172 SS1) TaxID=930990 RepID=A0A067MR30_BOTB1|nr:hypothetical protein BOTBODRAFT_33162 [Botryobasidium botryosum FD-172 SS1]
MSTWTTLEDELRARRLGKRKARSEKASASNTRQPTISNAIKDEAFTGDFIPLPFFDADELPETREKTRAKGKSHAKGKPRAKGSNRDLKRSPYERDRQERRWMKEDEHWDVNAGEIPWVSAVDWGACQDGTEMLNREASAFVEYISPTEAEHSIRGLVVESIRRAIVGRWGDATVTPFGSFETKLYLPLGDIDLVVNSAVMAQSDKKLVLTTLADVLEQAKVADDIRVIANARVPILKFVSSEGRFAIDISLNQINGISAGQIVNNFCCSMPALRPLVLIVKAFLNQNHLNDVFHGGLGSYSVICLVISFLQMHPKLRYSEIDTNEVLGVLLLEFFELYGYDFKYNECGISVQAGGFYFDKSTRGWQNEKQPYLLCIEDPQDSIHDISKQSHEIQTISETFTQAYGILSTTVHARTREIIKDEGRNNGSFDAESMSILGDVLRVSNEVVSRRRRIRELYSKGSLHRRLGHPPPSTTQLLSAASPVSFDHVTGPSNTTAQALHSVSEGVMSTEEETDDSADELIVSQALGEEDSYDELEESFEAEGRDKKRFRFEDGHEVIYISDDDGELPA